MNKKLYIIIAVTALIVIIIGGAFSVYRIITNDNGLKPMVGGGEKTRLSKFRVVDKVELNQITEAEVTEKRYNDEKTKAIKEVKDFEKRLKDDPNARISDSVVYNIVEMAEQQECVINKLEVNGNLDGVLVLKTLANMLENNRCNKTSSSTQSVTRIPKII